MQIISHTKQIGTVKQYADHVSVSDRTVHNWIAAGIIPSMKIGRNRRLDFAECDEALKKYGTETR